MVDYGRIGGKRRREFFDDEKKAQRALAHAQREAKKHGTHSVALQLSDRARFQDAERRLAGVGATLGQAVDFYIQHAAAVRHPLSVAELAEQCIAAKKAQGLRGNYTRMLHVPLDKLPQEIMAHEVTSHHVKVMLAHEEIKPKTRNNWLGYISTIWKWGKDNGMTSIDPTEGVERYADDRGEIDFLSVDECRKLLEHVRAKYPQWLAFHALGLFAGIRPEEIRRMTWADVRLDESSAIVRATSSKTRQRRIVELEPAAKSWLAPCDTTHRLMYRCLNKDLADLRRIIGRPWPHDAMRHTYASYHLQQFRDERKTQANMGHRSAALLFQHYRALTTTSEAKAFWEMRAT